MKRRGKIALKMSKNGAIERNLASGEDVKISKRSADFDMRSGPRESFSQLGKSYKPKKKRQQNLNQAEQNTETIVETKPPKPAEQSDGAERQEVRHYAEFEAPPTFVLRYDKADSPLKTERPSELKFTSEDKPQELQNKQKQRQSLSQTEKVVAVEPNNVQEFEPETLDMPPFFVPVEDNAAEPQAASADAIADSQPQSREPPESGETETQLKPPDAEKSQAAEEKTPSRGETQRQKKYKKAQSKADRAVKKLESAKSKLPAKKKLSSKQVFDEKSGKSKRKLYFESEVKPQSEHVKGALATRPIKAAANSALVFAHRKIYQVERENTAVEAAHKLEIAAESVARTALRHVKTAPYRKIAKLERKAQKSSLNAAYRKNLAENPKLQSNFFSRTAQKRKIKRGYAKQAREAQKVAKNAGSAVDKATRAVTEIIKKHPIAAIILALIALIFYCVMSLVGAFGSAGSGGLGGILAASYLADDAEIEASELDYTEWETDLWLQILNAENAHSGYDEYRYNLGEIGHNPHELMAYLTAKYQAFDYITIQSDLQALFAEQYALTFTPSLETKYATDNTPYDWHVMTVTLTVREFAAVALSHLESAEIPHYAVLLQSKGARQYLANPFGELDWLPYVSSGYGWRVHPISGAKDLHRGLDIALPLGTPILAAQDGTVIFAGNSGSYGNVVVIENADGLVSKYAHCDTILVTVGQVVTVGETIATIGSTGNSTGAHLHLEIMKNGEYLNPIYFTLR